MKLTLRKDLTRPLETAELDGNFVYLQSELDKKASAEQVATKVDKVEGMGLSAESFTAAEKSKLATTQIYTTGEKDKVAATDIFTSAEKSKLSSLESSHFRGTFTDPVALQVGVASPVAGDYADVDAGADRDTVRYIWDVSDAKWVASGAATPITAAQVKQLYESNPDTNAFTNAQKTKLAGVATDATKNQSDDHLLNRANHTGQQLASTVSDLAPAVRSVTALGLSVVNAPVTEADSLLVAVGKLQAQTNNRVKPGDFGVGATETADVIDCNTSKTQGTYRVTMETLNTPFTLAGQLEVLPYNGTNIQQRLTRYYGLKELQIFNRFMTDGSWTDWKTTATSQNGYSGVMQRRSAFNFNSPPQENCQFWADGSSTNGPGGGDWLVSQMFIGPDYLTQHAVSLINGDIRTRVLYQKVWGSWKAPGGGLTLSYQSPLMSYSNNQLFGLAHGFKTEPRIIEVFAVPTVDQSAWSSNLHIRPVDGFNAAGGVTEVFFKIAPGGLRVLNASTGNLEVCSTANWKVFVRAFA